MKNIKKFSLIVIGLMIMGNGCVVFGDKNINYSTTNTSSTPDGKGEMKVTTFDISTTDTVTKARKIQGLDINLELPESVGDLSYNGQTAPEIGTTVHFSTVRLTEMDQDCKARNAPLGSLVKSKTLPEGILNSQQASAFTYKKVGNEYIYYVHPQATCSQTKRVIDEQQRLLIDFKEALKQLK